MRTIHLSATAGPDGVLHLDVPVGSAGEFEVAVVYAPKAAVNGAGHKPTPEELGWPPGYFQNIIGSIDDPTFEAPRRQPAKPIEPLETESSGGSSVL